MSRAISVVGVGDDAAPEAVGAPDAAAEAFELDDLAVVDKQVDVRPVVLDVPAEHLRIGGLEHDSLKAQFARDGGDGVGAPGRDLLGDAFGFDHDHVRAGVQAASCEVDRVAYIAGSLLLELLRAGGATRAELNPDLCLGLEAGTLHSLDEPEDIVGRDADEPG